jgi:hypothetical protein
VSQVRAQHHTGPDYIESPAANAERVTLDGKGGQERVGFPQRLLREATVECMQLTARRKFPVHTTRTASAQSQMTNDQTDACDCPACLPYCERIGRKCFVECEGCRGKPERDEIGPLKCRTIRFDRQCAA